MEKLTKKAFCDLITAPEGVKFVACLNFNDTELLEADNKADIIEVLEKQLDTRLNDYLTENEKTAKHRTYKARSKDIVSNENTYLNYKKTTPDADYIQYKTENGYILNLLKWFDKWDNITRKKVMIYKPV